jgi:hypothetical protein
MAEQVAGLTMSNKILIIGKTQLELGLQIPTLLNLLTLIFSILEGYGGRGLMGVLRENLQSLLSKQLHSQQTSQISKPQCQDITKREEFIL